MRNVVHQLMDPTGSPGMVAVLLRSAEKEDSGRIVKLLNGTDNWPGYDHRGTAIDFWEWRYVHNPLGFTNEFIALTDDRVLSHAASLPTELRIHQHLRLCAQFSDLYTDPESRGQRLMESAMSGLHDRDLERGIEMEFAFPSLAGYDLAMKAGFALMPVRMGHYELITNPDQFFSNVRFGTFKKVAYEGMKLVKVRRVKDIEEVDIQEVDVFPDDITRLTNEFERSFDLVFHRDEKYLRWRYERPESGIYKIIVSRKNGAISGYAVLRPYLVSGKKYMDLVDLVVLLEDRDSLNALIDRSVEMCHQEEANMLQIWLPTDHPYLPELGRIGFLLRQPAPGERKMSLVCRQLTPDPLLKEQLAGDLKYHLVLGDSDWV
jgi:Acetyltransferase (GNAT) domain